MSYTLLRNTGREVSGRINFCREAEDVMGILASLAVVGIGGLCIGRLEGLGELSTIYSGSGATH